MNMRVLEPAQFWFDEVVALGRMTFRAGEEHWPALRALGSTRELVSIRRIAAPDGKPSPELLSEFGRRFALLRRLDGLSSVRVLESYSHHEGPEVSLTVETAPGTLTCLDLLALPHRSLELITYLTELLAWRFARLAEFEHVGLAVDLADIRLDVLTGALTVELPLVHFRRFTEQPFALVPSDAPWWLNSPDVIAGRKTPRSDMFTLGLILGALISGQRPYDGASGFELLKRIIGSQAPQVRSTVPRLDAFHRRCLASEEQRFESWDALLNELTAIRGLLPNFGSAALVERLQHDFPFAEHDATSEQQWARTVSLESLRRAALPLATRKSAQIRGPTT